MSDPALQDLESLIGREVLKDCVLFVATECPWPVRNGVTAKSGRLLDALQDIGVDHLIICPSHLHRAGAVIERSLSTPSAPRSRLLAVIAARPLPPRELGREATLDLMRELLQTTNPLAIHLDILSTAAWLPEIGALRDTLRPSCPIILSVNDSYSLYRSDLQVRHGSLLPRLEVLHHRRAERRAYGLADAVDVVSPVDAAEARRIAPGGNVRLLPLGRPKLGEIGATAPRPIDLLLFSAGPGLHNLFEVGLPRIRQAVPNARFVLVGESHGRLPPGLPERSGVEVLGYVDDLDSLLDQTKLVLAPSQQRSGSPNKAMQAMARSVTVVGGRCLHGIPGLATGTHGFVGPDTATLAAGAITMLEDNDLRERVGAAGRDLVGALPQWSDVAEKYIASLPKVRGGM